MISITDLLLLQNQSFFFPQMPPLTLPLHRSTIFLLFRPFALILEESLDGDMLAQQQRPFAVRAGLLGEAARAALTDEFFFGCELYFPQGCVQSGSTSTSLLMQASPRRGGRSCTGTGTLLLGRTRRGCWAGVAVCDLWLLGHFTTL